MGGVVYVGIDFLVRLTGVQLQFIICRIIHMLNRIMGRRPNSERPVCQDEE